MRFARRRAARIGVFMLVVPFAPHNCTILMMFMTESTASVVSSAYGGIAADTNPLTNISDPQPAQLTKKMAQLARP
jgi:hypothetical protein